MLFEIVLKSHDILMGFSNLIKIFDYLCLKWFDFEDVITENVLSI